MAIDNRNLAPGTKLVAHYKKEVYHALVVVGPEGKVLYQLSPYDGREFKSPSSLGMAVTGKSCNGWAFWSIAFGADEQAQGEEVEVPDPARQQESQAETAMPVDTFRRVPNQRGVPEGEVRLYCDACPGSFTTPVGQQPDPCPGDTGRAMLATRRKLRASCPSLFPRSLQAGPPEEPAFLSVWFIHHPPCQQRYCEVKSRGCTGFKDNGQPCQAPKLRERDYCLMHSPEHATEVAEARRLGGLRRRREVAVAGAYDFSGLQSVADIRRLLEVAILDTLGLENSVALSRTLAYLAMTAIKLLEVGKLEQRITALEGAVHGQKAMPEPVFYVE